jgi:DNA repair protein RadA/Sms
MKTRGKEKTIFVCTTCGQTHPVWMGKCSGCGEWNTVIEEKVAPRSSTASADTSTTLQPIGECSSAMQPMLATGLDEFDHLLGGGLVPDSSLLIGGEPGIGKSTLMLQVVGLLAARGIPSLYLTGEESTQQIGRRGERLGVTDPHVLVAAVRELGQIKSLIEQSEPGAVVIDSVQTLFDPDLESAPGTVNQIRSATAELIDFCKRRQLLLILIGHITKEGAIAGPKLLEHLVDVVLYFEGEKSNLFRILRARKNRFGPTADIGIFQIGQQGLEPVANPSELFLGECPADAPGRVVVSAVEGQRPILLELQALVSRTNFGFPQRVSSGFDLRRLNLLLAILEKREKIELGQQDVFINLVGGLRIEDPALDLGLAAAVLSSLNDVAAQDKLVIIGELGLSGEVRAVAYADRRINEAAKLGFEKVILPRKNLKGLNRPKGLELLGVERLSELPRLALL